jgi:hypothetical protein
VQQIDSKTTQLSPASNHVSPEPHEFGDQPTSQVDCSLFTCEPIEQNDFNSTEPEPIHERIVLVKQNDRLEVGMIKADHEVKQRLMGAANRSVFVAFDDQYARATRGVGALRHRYPLGQGSELISLQCLSQTGWGMR